MTPTDREKALWDKLGDMDRDAWRDERGAAFIAIAAALSEARKDAIEECAKVAALEANSFESDKSGDYRDAWYLCARGIARAIRALKERTP